jgi:hypothetical protein
MTSSTDRLVSVVAGKQDSFLIIISRLGPLCEKRDARDARDATQHSRTSTETPKRGATMMILYLSPSIIASLNAAIIKSSTLDLFKE